MYSDGAVNSNPAKNNFDWSVTRAVEMDNPGNQVYELAPGEVKTIFDGTRSLGINGSSQFTLALTSLAATRYRLTWTGTGAAPVFRTSRGLTNGGDSLTLTSNANSTLTVTGPAGAFTGVVAGDTVLIPGPTTGDTSTVFATTNEGLWLVLTATSTTLQLRRPTGVAYTGESEVVSVVSDGQFLAYSAAGVQVGDTIRLSAGFSASALQAYEIVAVTPTWVEFYTTSPLAVTETAVPGVSGLVIYNNAKNFVYLEYTQACLIQFNGNTSTGEIFEPWVAGDDDQTGISVCKGPRWSLVVTNVSQETLKLTYGSAE